MNKETKHTIEFYELLKGNYGHDTLIYFADGKEYNVTGEFYIDCQGILHHTHIFDDREELEVTCQYL